MTCFWDGIIGTLEKHDFEFIGIKEKPNIRDLIKILKEKNKKNINVKWQDIDLTNKFREESYLHIKDYDISKIGNGHLTSSCDPFLLLISEIFKIDIRHRYIDTVINYNVENARKTIFFKSSSSHFERGV